MLMGDSKQHLAKKGFSQPPKMGQLPHFGVIKVAQNGPSKAHYWLGMLFGRCTVQLAGVCTIG